MKGWLHFQGPFVRKLKTKEHKDSSMQGEQGYLPVIRFQPLLHLIQNEKITHRLGTKDVCSISTLVLPLYTLIHGDGISTILPFEGCNLWQLPLLCLLCSPLGPTHSEPIAVALKPFSTLVFRHFTWIVATTTKIGTREGFSETYVWPSILTSPRPPTGSGRITSHPHLV
jgi:hypothetical protein